MTNVPPPDPTPAPVFPRAAGTVAVLSYAGPPPRAKPVDAVRLLACWAGLTFSALGSGYLGATAARIWFSDARGSPPDPKLSGFMVVAGVGSLWWAVRVFPTPFQRRAFVGLTVVAVLTVSAWAFVVAAWA